MAHVEHSLIVRFQQALAALALLGLLLSGVAAHSTCSRFSIPAMSGHWHSSESGSDHASWPGHAEGQDHQACGASAAPLGPLTILSDPQGASCPAAFAAAQRGEPQSEAVPEQPPPRC